MELVVLYICITYIKILMNQLIFYYGISISHVYTEIERYGEDSLKNWRGLSMS